MAVNTLSASPVLAMSDKRKVRPNVRQTSVCRTTPANTDGDKLKFVGQQNEDFQRGAGMLEAEATADMLFMTQPFTPPPIVEATKQPVEVLLVRAVLSG